MKIIKAEHMGFCFGVKNAVDCAMKALDEDNKLYSYGEIIHNRDVVGLLESKGLVVINDLEKTVNDLDTRVLIRSHGVSKKTIEFLDKNSVKYIDATCPRVKNIHNIVDKYSNEGYEIIIIGDCSHPEVIGTIGWINGIYHTINSVEEVKTLSINRDNKYCLVCQTTFYDNIYKEIVEFLNKNDYTNIVKNNTICDATKKRQESCVDIAANSDVVLVIGGKSSSNTKKLFELCKTKCKNTFLIENYREIPYKYIDKNTKIGITAGASTPDWVIEEVIQYVRESE